MILSDLLNLCNERIYTWKTWFKLHQN